jgi:hypothetical protein
LHAAFYAMTGFMAVAAILSAVRGAPRKDLVARPLK